MRASAVQAERLLGWAQAWPERAWAVEGAGGLGHLLAQQLLSAGERVLDAPPAAAACPAKVRFSDQARAWQGSLELGVPATVFILG